MEGVGEEVEPPGRHHPGVELAQGAGAGIARIGEQCLAPGLPFRIDGGKGAIGNQRLTAHFQPGGRIAEIQAQGHAGDGAHVGGDLLALFAIAAGGRPHQHTPLIAEGEGIAIDLEFAHHWQGDSGQAWQCQLRGRDAIQHLEQTPIPGLQLCL